MFSNSYLPYKKQMVTIHSLTKLILELQKATLILVSPSAKLMSFLLTLHLLPTQHNLPNLLLMYPVNQQQLAYLISFQILIFILKTKHFLHYFYYDLESSKIFIICIFTLLHIKYFH